MLDEYVDQAMQHARYERMEDGTYLGTIPGYEGLWANGRTEQECSKALREALEGWIMLGLTPWEELYY